MKVAHLLSLRPITLVVLAEMDCASARAESMSNQQTATYVDEPR